MSEAANNSTTRAARLGQFPLEGRTSSRWVGYTLDPNPENPAKPKKTPRNVTTGFACAVTDSKNWSSYAEAVKALDRTFTNENGENFKLAGIGWVIAIPHIGVDFDGCIDPATGELLPWVQAALEKCPATYTEKSQSGCGIHLLYSCDNHAKLGKSVKGKRAEIYRDKRYFVVTGDHIESSPAEFSRLSLAEANDLYALIARLKQEDNPEILQVRKKRQSEADLLPLLLKGDWENRGFPSQSEADKELCKFLAQKHDGKSELIDRDFRASGLMRPKWDEQHGEATYGAITIAYVLKTFKPAPRVEIRSKPLSATEAEVIAWLKENYFPIAMLVTLFAPKGRGKTKICDYLTSRISAGLPWWDGAPCRKGTVIRFNLEDPVALILRPGLHAAGADPSKVEIVECAVLFKDGESSEFSIDLTNPLHIAAVEAKIREFPDARLVIIEPVNNYKGRAKSISEDDMRPLYMELSQLALKCNVCILAINHANKRKDVDVLEKSLGAGSGPSVARVNFFLDKNPDNKAERMLTDAGSNVPLGPTLVFTIEPVADFELDGKTHKNVGIAKFIRTDEITGDELLEQTQTQNRSQSDRIAAFLGEFLTGKGEIDTEKVKAAAAAENREWSWDLVKQVFRRRKLGTSRDEGGGKNKKTFWTVSAPSKPRLDLKDDAPF